MDQYCRRINLRVAWQAVANCSEREPGYCRKNSRDVSFWSRHGARGLDHLRGARGELGTIVPARLNQSRSYLYVQPSIHIPLPAAPGDRGSLANFILDLDRHSLGNRRSSGWSLDPECVECRGVGGIGRVLGLSFTTSIPTFVRHEDSRMRRLHPEASYDLPLIAWRHAWALERPSR